MNKHTNIAKSALLVAALALSQQALAQGFQGNDEATKASCQRYRDNTTAAKQKELEKYIPKPANDFYQNSSCLDQILNTRVNIFTIGSLDGVLQQIMNAASNKACSVVLGSWNQAVGTANGTLGTSANVPYIGNVGSVGVGTGFGGSPINVNGGSFDASAIPQQAQTQVQQTQNTASKSVTGTTSVLKNTANKLLNIFK